MLAGGRPVPPPRIGLGAPYLESWLDGAPQPAEPASSIVGPARLWAAVTALVAFGWLYIRRGLEAVILAS